MLLGLPLLAFVALAIKLDSRGPVFFAQERVGKGGRRFRLYKFRTMVSDAEQLRDELLASSTDPNWLKLDRDPRVTRIGRHLRRLSLDELPQLWNVVRGDMSMVGPRPLVPAEDERVLGWARGRLDLTPGITGYWQVLGRTRIPFEEMVKLDYLYVMNWSLWEDVRLMLRTLPVVLGEGAQLSVGSPMSSRSGPTLKGRRWSWQSTEDLVGRRRFLSRAVKGGAGAAAAATATAAAMPSVAQADANVAVLNAPNTFTANQTIASDGSALTITRAAGQALLRFENIASRSNACGAMVFAGTNGLGNNGEAWAMGIDVFSYSDFFLGKVVGGGTVHDMFYFQYRDQTHDPVLWIGGGTNDATAQVTIRAATVNPEPSMGNLKLIASSGQTAPALEMRAGGYPGLVQYETDVTGHGWVFRHYSDTTGQNDVITIQDKDDHTVVVFQLTSNGRLYLGGDGYCGIYRSSAGTLGVLNGLDVRGQITLGTDPTIGFFRAGYGTVGTLRHLLVRGNIGFYNTPPVPQPSASGLTSGYRPGTGQAVTVDETFTGGTGTTAYTIGDIVAALKTLGLVKS